MSAEHKDAGGMRSVMATERHGSNYSLVLRQHIDTYIRPVNNRDVVT